MENDVSQILVLLLPASSSGILCRPIALTSAFPTGSVCHTKKNSCNFCLCSSTGDGKYFTETEDSCLSDCWCASSGGPQWNKTACRESARGRMISKKVPHHLLHGCTCNKKTQTKTNSFFTHAHTRTHAHPLLLSLEYTLQVECLRSICRRSSIVRADVASRALQICMPTCWPVVKPSKKRFVAELSFWVQVQGVIEKKCGTDEQKMVLEDTRLSTFSGSGVEPA